MYSAAEIESEVELRLRERSADLLPLLLDRMVVRAGVVECVRHAAGPFSALDNYIGAQKILHRAKRNPDYWGKLENWIAYRDMMREQYRQIPCTCWRPKR